MMVFSRASRETCSGLKVVDLGRLTSPRGAGSSSGGGGVAPGINGSSARASTSRATAKEFPNSDQEYSGAMYHNSDFEFFQDLGLLCCDPVREGPALTTDYQLPEKDKHNTDTATRLQPQPPPPPAPAPIDDIFELYDLGSDKFPEQFQDILVEELDGRAFGGWADSHTYTHTPHKSPFIEEDSLDMKLGEVVPRELALNDTLVSEVLAGRARPPALALGGAHCGAQGAPPPAPAISTPDVVSYVEELEARSPPFNMTDIPAWAAPSPALDYEPITPKTESHIESDDSGASPARPAPRRRRRSDDSDYSPYTEKSPRKYRKRKNIPLQEMIHALEESQPAAKARRGRPPKRRDSAASSVCSGDVPHGHKYREIRDKNNEASKRSRINRKLKELQTEQLALDLEDRNAKLRVKANILEDMTKRLKDALMTAILKP